MKIKKIKIKKFKAIESDGLELNELSKINYLIGKNGSGKSSVIDILELFSSPNLNFIKKNKNLFSEVLLKIFEDYNYEYKNYIAKNPDIENNIDIDTKESYNFDCFNKFISLEDASLQINSKKLSLKGEFYSKLLSQKVTRIICDQCDPYNFYFTNYNTGKIDTSTGIYVNSVNNQLKKERGRYIKTIKLSEMFNPHPDYISGEFVNEINRKALNENEPYLYELIGLLNDFTDCFDKYASGYKQIQQFLRTFTSTEVIKSNTILIEEPETGLHPLLQKKIPKILELICSCKAYGNAQFIVSTHSPFIINSSSNYRDHKTYIIDKGKCLNPLGDSYKNIKGVVSGMLGADIKDIAPSNVVFCAQTEKEFLQKINHSWYFKDIKFITPKYEGKINGGDECIAQIEAFNEAGRFKDTFYGSAELYFYVDKPNKFQSNNNNLKYESFIKKSKKIAQIIVSDKESFEAKFDNNELSNYKLKNALKIAEYLIKNGEKGRKKFENKFPELSKLLGFKK